MEGYDLSFSTSSAAPLPTCPPKPSPKAWGTLWNCEEGGMGDCRGKGEREETPLFPFPRLERSSLSINMRHNMGYNSYICMWLSSLALLLILNLFSSFSASATLPLKWEEAKATEEHNQEIFFFAFIFFISPFLHFFKKIAMWFVLLLNSASIVCQWKPTGEKQKHTTAGCVIILHVSFSALGGFSLQLKHLVNKMCFQKKSSSKGEGTAQSR